MGDGALTRRLGFPVLAIPSTFLYMDKCVRLVVLAAAVAIRKGGSLLSLVFCKGRGTLNG